MEIMSKKFIEKKAVSLLGALSRSFKSDRFRSFIKSRIFDRHFNWRRINLECKTEFGARIELRLPDSIQNSILLTGVWEPLITRTIQRDLQKGDVFIDIGANIGYYTLLASRIVGASGKVYAFEASPSIFKRLERNLAINRSTNVRIQNIAISSHAGTCSIWTAPEGNLGHSTIMDKVALSDGHAKEATVACDSIANLIPPIDLFKARFIKVDIEGAERMMMEGVKDVLENFSEDTEWIMELSPEFCPNGTIDTNFIFNIFTEAGYSCYQIPRPDRVGDIVSDNLIKLESAPTGRLNDVVFSKNPDRSLEIY